MRFYKFDEFKIDTAKRKFFSDRQELNLRDRDFDVLVFLIQNRSETLSKDEIIRAVWKGTVVEDNSVERSIVNIRKVLGDDAANPYFIKTVRGKGYLLVCDVVESNEESIDRRFDSKVASKDAVVSEARAFPRFAAPVILIALLISGLGVVFMKAADKAEYLSAKTVFYEDFEDETLNSERWKTKGDSVKVNDGIARVSKDKLSRSGKLISDYFEFDATKPLVIKSRMRVTYNQSVREMVNFVGSFGLVGKNPKEDFVGVKYTKANVRFTREGDVTLDGVFLTNSNADLLNEYAHCDGTIGPRADALWGEWFEQNLVYDPRIQNLSLFIDGKKAGEFPVKSLPVADGKLRLFVNPRGLFLHHSIEIDDVEVSQ